MEGACDRVRGEIVNMRAAFCRWKCGRQTPNRSGICDPCWADRDRIYAERKATGAARGAQPKQLSAKQRASLEKATAARMAKLTKKLPATEFSLPRNG